MLENSGRSDRLVHLFLVTECHKAEQEGEEDIKVELVEPAAFWNSLMNYFAEDPTAKHGGGNTLKLAALAFQKLGWITPGSRPS